MRIGIGRAHDGDAIDRVLGNFSDEERAALPAIVDRAVEGIAIWRDRGVTPAMNFVNPQI